jgi:hypothetical protein
MIAGEMVDSTHCCERNMHTMCLWRHSECTYYGEKWVSAANQSLVDPHFCGNRSPACLGCPGVTAAFPKILCMAGSMFRIGILHKPMTCLVLMF